MRRMSTDSSVCSSTSTTDDACKGNKDTGRIGRFSQEEKKILVSLILDDPHVLSAFCHQQRKQNIQGKSFMHLITDRFNEKTSKFRSHDAVRHHLKLRRSNLSSATKKQQGMVSGSRDVRMLEKLLEHRWICTNQDSCTRCLQMHRLRVQRRLASCGYENCFSCDKRLPAVKDRFNPKELLAEIRKSLTGGRPDLMVPAPPLGFYEPISPLGSNNASRKRTLVQTSNFPHTHGFSQTPPNMPGMTPMDRMKLSPQKRTLVQQTNDTLAGLLKLRSPACNQEHGHNNFSLYFDEIENRNTQYHQQTQHHQMSNPTKFCNHYNQPCGCHEHGNINPFNSFEQNSNKTGVSNFLNAVSNSIGFHPIHTGRMDALDNRQMPISYISPPVSPASTLVGLSIDDLLNSPTNNKTYTTKEPASNNNIVISIKNET